MDEARKYPDPVALSEEPQSADQEGSAAWQSGMSLSVQEQEREHGIEGADSVTDAALSGEEVAEQEIEPRLPLWSGAGKGRRLVRKADQHRVVLTGAQRLLLLDTWRRSQLPAGDFAPLIGVTKHSLYAWKKRFDQEGPAGLADRTRRARSGSRVVVSENSVRIEIVALMSRSIWFVAANHLPKPGGHFSIITSSSWFRQISSWCQPSISSCCSSS